jgi:hypothetical protein
MVKNGKIASLSSNEIYDKIIFNSIRYYITGGSPVKRLNDLSENTFLKIFFTFFSLCFLGYSSY